MTALEEFREEVEAAIAALESSASTYGRLVAGDPGFVFGLRKGREPRLSTMERVRRRTERLLEENAADPAGRQKAGSADDTVQTAPDRREGRGSGDTVTPTGGEAQRQPPETGRSRAA